MTSAGLQARIEVHRPGFTLDIDLEIAPGEVLALLGPNGAGKSTALLALAGLVPLTGGTIVLDGQTLDDAYANLLVRTEDRPVGMVFQNYLLFPHLDALENVAFGLRARGARRRDARSQARGWLERVGLGDHADAKPGELSGGQAQRVALARALVTAPRLLLLDEPLAALDASTRLEIRSDLHRHLDDFSGTVVLVTHDPLDALVLADRLVVIENGQVVQQGTPQEVASAPRTDYVARLVGLNLYRGQAEGTTVRLEGGGVLSTAHPAAGPVFVAFRPAAVSLHRDHPSGSPRNVWQGRITGMEHHGDTVRVKLDASPAVLADVTTAAVAELELMAEQEVWVAVKATEIDTYPA